MALVTVEEYQARQGEIRLRMESIDQEHAGRVLPQEIAQEWTELRDELSRNDETIEELELRRRTLDEIQGKGDSKNTERGASFHTARPGVARGQEIYDLTTVRSSALSPAQAAHEMRDRALTSIDASVFPHRDADQAKVKEHLERLLSADNDDGAIARHLLLTGSDTYARAFAKYTGDQSLSPDEQRAMSLTSANGGYAVPYTLDPTVIPTSNSSVNPYRGISRVEAIPGNTWKGVTSSGITASRNGEAVEVGDNSPTLGQPSVTTTKVDVFVPFSVEIDHDWAGIQAALAVQLQDAKDDEEAVSFTTGDGNGNNPEGLITGATRTFATASSATFAAGDLYAIEDDLPPRFRQRAQWVAARGTWNKVRQFDTAGGAQLWLRIADGLDHGGNTGYQVLGYNANESSAMSTRVSTTSEKIAILGDFRHFLIVDTIGMRVEIIQHLFATPNNRPSGQRGLYAHWRNTCKVLVPSAFRVLTVR